MVLNFLYYYYVRTIMGCGCLKCKLKKKTPPLMSKKKLQLADIPKPASMPKYSKITKARKFKSKYSEF